MHKELQNLSGSGRVRKKDGRWGRTGCGYVCLEWWPRTERLSLDRPPKRWIDELVNFAGICLMRSAQDFGGSLYPAVDVLWPKL